MGKAIKEERPDELAGNSKGAQGVDKAPGEETPQSANDNKLSQKGKKVDANPLQEQDQPLK